MSTLLTRALPLAGYGSDSTGLVCAFRFASDGYGEPVTAQTVLESLTAESEEGAFFWVHFNLANNAARRWMETHLALPDVFYQTIDDGSRTTRVEFANDQLIAVLNDALFDFEAGIPDVSTLWLCLDRRLMVSARRKPLRSIDRLRHAVRQREAFLSPVALLVHLLHDQSEVLAAILREATTRVDGIEDGLLAERLDHRRANLGTLRRSLVRLSRLFAPEPAALFRLLNRPPQWIGGGDAQELRQSTEEFAAALADAAALLERTKLLHEEIAARVNEQNNRSLFLLTVFTVLALPINIIAGLFGMNVGGIPLAQETNGFWIVVGIVTLVTSVGTWLVFRRKA
jgi:zinc transporter